MMTHPLLVAVLMLLAAAGPAGADTIGERFSTFGPVVTGSYADVNHFDVDRIELRWAAQAGAAETILWRVDAVRPVDFRGLHFQLYRQPPGFRTLTLHQAPGPKHGVYILAVHRAVPNGPRQGFRVTMSPRQATSLMADPARM